MVAPFLGIEIPPFVAAPFRADALTVLKLPYFKGGDAKSLVIGGAIRQPKVGVLAATHGYFRLRQSRLLTSRTASGMSLSSGFQTETQRGETGFADRIKVHSQIDEQLHAVGR
jgi:hypothetical protein